LGKLVKQKSRVLTCFPTNRLTVKLFFQMTLNLFFIFLLLGLAKV